MFTHLTVKGLHPRDLSLSASDPMGPLVIAGPSGAGKSTLARAVCWLLFGTEPDGSPFDVSSIRTDTDEPCATVEGVTRKGTTFRRTIRPTRAQTRVVLKPPPEGMRAPLTVRCETEEQWREQLGRIGELARVSRLVLCPLAWRELAAGNARALRDVLADLSGVAADLRPTVRRLLLAEGHDLRPDDPIDPKAAEELRARAKQVEASAGAVLEHQRRDLAALDGEPPPGPTPEDVERARTVLAARAAHVTAAGKLAAWEERNAARGAWLMAYADLDARRPEYDPEALWTAEADLRRLVREREASEREATRLAEVDAEEALLASVEYPAVIHPAWVRLAGELLDAYADRLGNDGCNDYQWPAWFPMSERAPFVRAMERANGGGPEDVERSLALYSREDGPPNWWVARFLADTLAPKEAS